MQYSREESATTQGRKRNKATRVSTKKVGKEAQLCKKIDTIKQEWKCNKVKKKSSATKLERKRTNARKEVQYIKGGSATNMGKEAQYYQERKHNNARKEVQYSKEGSSTKQGRKCNKYGNGKATSP